MQAQQVLEKAISADGTPIAMWRSGAGRPLVLVHGTAADHSRWDSVRGLFEPQAAVHAVDRRGRGASGDAEEYSIEREYEDIAAAVDAVAASAGEPVDLVGHSYGAMCAMAAATLTPNVRRLALYEPAVLGSGVYPPGFGEWIEQLLAEGRRDDLLVTFFQKVAGLSEDQVAAMRTMPSWPARVAAAHTLVREERATTGYRLDRERVASLPIPVLLLTGTTSPEVLRDSTEKVGSLLPAAKIAVLEGHGHAAMDTGSQLFADIVTDFIDRP
jgi:pimeloyl-ACP methyl ester carboxylesterase